MKDEANILGLSNQKGGDAISEMRECTGGTGVGGGHGHQESDLGHVELKC